MERGKSPIAGRWRLFKTERGRNTAIGLGCISAFLFLGIGVHSAFQQKIPGSKIEGVGSQAIAQVTGPPAAPPADKPITQPAIVATPPAAAGKTDIVATPVDYVHLPASSGEVSFEVPAWDDKPAADKNDTHGAATKDADVTRVAFKASTLTGAKAGPAIDLTYVMLPQLVPCALDTAMDSTVAGAVECHTTAAVRSSLHVLLMPTHTQILGVYKNDVKAGQNRLFGFTGSAITPEGIPVPLDNSTFADGLGRAGIGATDVNNHIPERFGAALLLTGSAGMLNLAQAALSKQGQTSLNIGNGGSGIESIASQILQSQINIPPTISVKPGTIVSIVVDHPISFADAIRVRTR